MADLLLLEDGVSYLLLEDGVSRIILEASAPRNNTTTGLVTSANPIVVGQNAIFTATVTPVSGVAVPTGTISFFNGAALLGTASLNGAAQATFTFTAVLHPPGPLGPNSITAVYSGDVNYNPSTSSVLVEVVSPLTSSFLRTSRGPLWRRVVR